MQRHWRCNLAPLCSIAGRNIFGLSVHRSLGPSVHRSLGCARAFASATPVASEASSLKLLGAFSSGILAGAGIFYLASQGKAADPVMKVPLDASDPVHPYKRILYIMRGVPCSGKSTIAHGILHRHLVSNGISGRLDEIIPLSRGFILSTDDFFSRVDEETGKEKTVFDMKQIRRNHEQNQTRCAIAMELGITPIIIDNTNTLPYEMRGYVELAKAQGYQILFKDAMEMQNIDLDTIKQRLSAREVETGKNVPIEAVERMMKRYWKLPGDVDKAIDLILESEPPWKKKSSAAAAA